TTKAVDQHAFANDPYDRLLNGYNFHNTPPLLKLSVTDDGPGIPSEILPKIFQPYFTTKGPKQGTGLGLNIVQRLIKEAKGALHVHTRVGEGTRFTISLPAALLAKYAGEPLRRFSRAQPRVELAGAGQ